MRRKAFKRAGRKRVCLSTIHLCSDKESQGHWAGGGGGGRGQGQGVRGLCASDPSKPQPLIICHSLFQAQSLDPSIWSQLEPPCVTTETHTHTHSLGLTADSWENEDAVKTTERWVETHIHTHTVKWVLHLSACSSPPCRLGLSERGLLFISDYFCSRAKHVQVAALS